MYDYHAPLKDMKFAVNELADLPTIAQLPGFADATPDMLDAILEESARFHHGVIAPLNRVGDTEGAQIVDGEVKAATGFSEAYQQYTAAGWGGLAMDPAYEGQGMPLLMAIAVQEMTQSACLSFSLCPMLGQGAIHALESHGSDELKQCYLGHMINGSWAGTMNLTEPQAGSDLAAVRTKAQPQGDHYLISGQKIYITWGDHDMTENIVHLVLARTPDAPAGAAGISLFLVPKYLVNADGTLGERNDVYPASLEHKLGIHASPTCVMSYGDKGGAVGYLVGKENKGLANMFTMMNHARLGVGLQGLSISERAYQQAVAYARDRVQGRASNGEGTIINHPDVRRMLMLMKSSIEAMRALAYTTEARQDLAAKSDDGDIVAANQQRVDLMTPIIKGWLTEMANEVTSLGVQIHGGMGFVEETGAAQHLRDARILAIYEGTNGIQSLDLVGRKLLRDGGRAMTALLGDMQTTLTELQAQDSLKRIAEPFATAVAALKQASAWTLERGKEENVPESVAFNLLMLAGYVSGGWQMARAALVASAALAAGSSDDDFYRGKITTAQFFAEHFLPRATAHLATIKAGADTVMALDVDMF
jgi:acyl-CoA dehydrogenase